MKKGLILIVAVIAVLVLGFIICMNVENRAISYEEVIENTGGDIRVEEQLLHGDHIRLQLADKLLHVPVDLVEPFGQRQPRRGGDGPIGHHSVLCPLPFDQPEADGGVAGVDA